MKKTSRLRERTANGNVSIAYPTPMCHNDSVEFHFRLNQAGEYRLLSPDELTSPIDVQAGDIWVGVLSTHIFGTRYMSSDYSFAECLDQDELPPELRWTLQAPDGSLVSGPFVGPH